MTKYISVIVSRSCSVAQSTNQKRVIKQLMTHKATRIYYFQDGHIDFREFMIVLYIMSNGTPEENLKQIFRVFDINNDGKITLKELQKIVRDLFLLINESNADKASQEVLVKSGIHEVLGCKHPEFSV